MVLSIYSGKNEVGLLSERLVCNGTQLLVYQKGEDGFIKNEGKDTNVLPRACLLYTSRCV